MHMERSGISWSSGFTTVAVACCAFMLAVVLSCWLAPCAFAGEHASNPDGNPAPSAVSDEAPSAGQGGKAPSSDAGAPEPGSSETTVSPTAPESPVALASPSGATETASPAAVGDSSNAIGSSTPTNPAASEDGVGPSNFAGVADVTGSSDPKDADGLVAPADSAGPDSPATSVNPASESNQAVSGDGGDQPVPGCSINATGQVGADCLSDAVVSNGRKIAKPCETVCDAVDQLCPQDDDPNAISGIDANQTIAYAMYIPSTKRLVFGRCLPRDIRSWENGIVLFTGFEGATYNIAAEVPWIMFASLVSDVEFVNDVAPISTAYWFASFSRLAAFDANGHLDMSKAVNAKGMFSGCSSLRSVNMDGWDVGNLTQVDGIFEGCSQLSEVKGFNVVIRSLHSSGHTVSGLAALQQFGIEHQLTGSLGDHGNQSDNGPGTPDDNGAGNDGGVGDGGQPDEPSAVVGDGGADASADGSGTVIENGPVADQPSGSLDVNSPEKPSGKTRNRQSANASSSRSSVFVSSNDAINGAVVDEITPTALLGLNVGTGDPALNPEQAAEQAALILVGTAECASKMAKSAYNSCRSSLINAMPTLGEALSHAIPNNPFEPFVAGAGIVCAAVLMAAFALKIG